MDVLFKKYFWVVNLAAIAVLSWLVATGINNYLATELFAVPSARAESDVDDETAASALYGRVGGEEEAATVLRGRRIFSLDSTLPDGEAEPEEEKEEEKEEPKAEGELEESELNIVLIGTLVDPAGVASMATITVENENKLAWVGNEFLDGKAKVVDIKPRHMVIREGNELKVVKLWSDKGAQGGKQAAARGAVARPGRGTVERPKPATRGARSRSGRPDYSKFVKKTGAYEYEIDRTMLDEQLEDLSKIGREARVVPNYRGGKYEGFKLVGVRPGSLYRTLGIRSGDVIKGVNGVAFDSPNKALDLFNQMKSASNVSLDISRRGQEKQIQYSIK